MIEKMNRLPIVFGAVDEDKWQPWLFVTPDGESYCYIATYDDGDNLNVMFHAIENALPRTDEEAGKVSDFIVNDMRTLYGELVTKDTKRIVAYTGQKCRIWNNASAKVFGTPPKRLFVSSMEVPSGH